AVSNPVGRGFDLRIRRKGDRKGIVGITVFLPALRSGRAAGGKGSEREGEQAHVGLLSAKMAQPAPPPFWQGLYIIWHSWCECRPTNSALSLPAETGESSTPQQCRGTGSPAFRGR